MMNSRMFNQNGDEKMIKKPQEEAWDSHTIDFVLNALINEFGYENVKDRLYILRKGMA